MNPDYVKQKLKQGQIDSINKKIAKLAKKNTPNAVVKKLTTQCLQGLLTYDHEVKVLMEYVVANADCFVAEQVKCAKKYLAAKTAPYPILFFMDFYNAGLEDGWNYKNVLLGI
ncbi:hypothetical protein [Vibrio cholerae]|uniref:hypothetical protein n=1 Tax=Vibrio cholerae TaxID=666 RepID=UPI001C308EB0